MALRWTDGFELYANNLTGLSRKYATAVINTSAFRVGRKFGRALSYNGTNLNTPTFANHATWIAGFGFLNVGIDTTTAIFSIKDGGNRQVGLYFDGTHFSVQRSSTVLDTGSITIAQGGWYFVEMKATIDNSAGSVETRVAGVTDISFSGDTQFTDNAYANNCNFKGTAGGAFYALDDVYICDGSGSSANDFLSDIAVEPLFATFTGTNTNWTPTSGYRNYQAAIDPFDGITITTSSTSVKDSYRFQPLLFVNTGIVGVNVSIFARNSDSTAHNLSALVRQGGVDYASTAQSITDTVNRYKSYIYEQDPTSATWSVSTVNANEYGATT